MIDFTLFGSIVLILCTLPIPKFNKILLVIIFGFWTIDKVVGWLVKRFDKDEYE